MAREKATQEFTHIKQIKNEQGVVLKGIDMIVGKWEGYHDKRLNENNHRSVFEDRLPNEGLSQYIYRNEANVEI